MNGDGVPPRMKAEGSTRPFWRREPTWFPPTRSMPTASPWPTMISRTTCARSTWPRSNVLARRSPLSAATVNPMNTRRRSSVRSKDSGLPRRRPPTLSSGGFSRVLQSLPGFFLDLALDHPRAGLDPQAIHRGARRQRSRSHASRRSQRGRTATRVRRHGQPARTAPRVWRSPCQ